MNCPTCNLVMHKLVEWHYWCSRCGTVRTVTGSEQFHDEAPSLVEAVKAADDSKRLGTTIRRNRVANGECITPALWADVRCCIGRD